MKNNNLKNQFISGISITFFTKYFNVFVNIIISAILARLLTPTEFGIVSVVLVFTTFFNMISQLGVGPAIIQHKDLTERDISNIFKFLLIISLLVAIGFYYFSYLIANFYDNQIYIKIGQLLSVAVLFSTLSTVPMALLSQEKRFKTIGIIRIISTTVGGIVAIFLAIFQFSYFSIVVKSIIVSVITFVLSYYVSKLKIKKGFNFKGVSIIKNYSTFQFLFNFINYFSRNIDNLLIGKFIGPAALGYYDKAYRLMTYPVQNLTHVITPVIHPLLSDYQENRNKIYSVYKNLSKYLAMLGVPICVVLFFYSKEIILVFYGNQWLPVVPTFKVLSVSIIIQIILSSSGSIFQAAGRTDMLFLSGLLSAIFMILGISIGVFNNRIEFVAFGILIAMMINFFQTYYLLINKVLSKSLMDFLLNLKSPFYIAIFLILPNYLIVSYLNDLWFIHKLLIGLIFNLVLWLSSIFIFKEDKFMHINVLIDRIKRN